MSKIRSIIVLVTLLMFNADAYSQGCVMCKAVGEGHAESQGSNIADGLNSGIIYLIIVVYILLFILFRKRIIGFVKELSSMR